MKPFICLIVSIALFTLNPAWAESTVPDYSNINSGTLILYHKGTLADAIVLNSKVNMHISGPIADVVLIQKFRNISNEWAEGTYVFPLPESASVRSMRISVGERSIEGAIHERMIAAKKYKQASENGKLASIVTMQRNNLFTTKIANIPPGETVSIELDYFQSLRQIHDEYNWQMPTTYTPRYNPKDLRDMSFISTHSETLVPEVDIQVILDSPQPLAEIHSTSHELDVIRLDDKYLVSLQGDTVAMDRDFLLSWKENSTHQPQVLAYEQKKNQERYALFVIKPPGSQHIKPQPREVIFVLDISGSMSGNSIRAAKAALSKALDKLNENDRFNIIAFNETTQRLHQYPQQAKPEIIASAKHYLKGLNADGGTEIYSAIQLALTQQNTELLRQIVLITDGSVGNEAEILQLLHTDLNEARLFTVGIGTAPNTFFMHKAAQMGRGNSRFIADGRSVEAQVTSLFNQLTLPALISLSVQTDSAHSDVLPHPIPDLYAGQPLQILAKLTNSDKTLIVNGSLDNQPWQKTIDLTELSSGSTAISSLWAREKIEQLMDKQWTSGGDDRLRQQIVDLSVKHGVLSAYTGFLAVESTPIRDKHTPLKHETIKSLLPSNSKVSTADMIHVSLPQGGTSAGIWLAFGLLILIINTIIRLNLISWRIKQ